MRGRASGWVWAAWLAASCGGEEGTAPAASPGPTDSSAVIDAVLVVRPLPVAVHGCAGLAEGPSCWRGGEPARLTLWIAGEQPKDAITVLVDGMPLVDSVAIDADAEGVRIVVEVPPTASRLELSHSDGRRFSLELVPEPPAWIAARDELLAMRKAQRPAPEVRARLAQLRATLEPIEAHRLDCLELALVRETEDWTAVVEGPWRLERASPPHADFACLARSHIRAAYGAIMREPDYAKVRAHLEAARGYPLSLEVGINADYIAGLLEMRLGRLDESLAWLSRAARLAQRNGFVGEYAAAVVEQATVLAALGRFDEAKALADRAEATLDPEHRLMPEIRSNAAWVQILLREDDPSLPDPSAALRELAGHYEREGNARANGVRLNLAVAASQRGDLRAAAEALARVDRRALKDAAEQVFWEIVTARIAEGRRARSTARGHLERARVLAELGTDDGLILRARLARAELELRAGAKAAARDELEQVELIEDRIALGISPSAGRSTYSSARRHHRALHMEILLELGEPDAALCTVLGARARHLRSLRARRDRRDETYREQQERLLMRHAERRLALAKLTADSWALPADELAALRKRSALELEQLEALLAEAMALGEREPPPWRCENVRSAAPDTALLTMHPAAAAGRWWWIFDRAGAVEVVAIEHDGEDEAESAARAASHAVAQLADAGHLDGLRTLTVVAIGSLNAVDLHVLPPLQAIEVRYSVGLGRAQAPAAVARSVALLVGASQNLREPRAEAAWAGRALREAGWAVLDPWSPETAPQPTLLHYAGHGRHGGTAGWGSELVLADGDLGAAQIIAYQHSPAIVVLGACDAGTSDPTVIDGGMNVATAFVLAGAELVIAPHSAVDDHDARALAEVLYTEPPGPEDPAALAGELRARLAAAQRREPRFSHWRAWVP